MASIRITSALLTAALGVLLIGQEAQAQVRFSVVGPGSTPQGDALRGEGIFLEGAGEFIRNSAVAESIHVDTWIRAQEYFAAVRVEQARRFEALLKRKKENNNLAVNAIKKRLRENPNESDLMTGDALNVLLEDLTDPNIPPSVLMRTRIPVPVSFVQQVPFQVPTMGGTVCMRILCVKDGWPLWLRGDEFALERKAYLRAVDRVLEQILKGKLMPEAVEKLQRTIYELQDKVNATIPQSDLKAYLQAKDFAKALGDQAKLLQSQTIEKMIAQLERYPGTTIAELLEFMLANNVQFSPVVTPSERTLYTQLHQLLRQQKQMMDLPAAGLNNGQAIDPGKNEP